MDLRRLFYSIQFSQVHQYVQAKQYSKPDKKTFMTYFLSNLLTEITSRRKSRAWFCWGKPFGMFSIVSSLKLNILDTNLTSSILNSFFRPARNFLMKWAVTLRSGGANNNVIFSEPSIKIKSVRSFLVVLLLFLEKFWKTICGFSVGLKLSLAFDLPVFKLKEWLFVCWTCWVSCLRSWKTFLTPPFCN